MSDDRDDQAAGARLALFPTRKQSMTLAEILDAEAAEILRSPAPVKVDVTVRYESYGRSYSTRMVAEITKPTSSGASAAAFVERLEVE